MHEGVESTPYDRYANLYIDKFGPFVRHLRTGRALTIIDAKQTAGDLSGAATNELFVVRTLSRGYHHIDFGNGMQSEWWDTRDFAICPPMFANSVVSESPHHIHIYSVHYPTVKALDWDCTLPADGDFRSLHSKSCSTPVLTTLLNALLTDDPLAWDPLAEDIAITQLFIHLEACLHSPRLKRRAAKEKLCKAAARRAIERLCAIDLPTPTLPELSALAGLSTSHFCRAFHAETGLSPHRYNIVQRIRRARDLLKQSALPQRSCREGRL